MNAYPPPYLYRSDSYYYSTETKKRPKSSKHDTLLKWKTAPKNVLIIKKINDESCTKDTIEVVLFLLNEQGSNVYFQESTFQEIVKLSTSTEPKDDEIKQNCLEIMETNKNRVHSQKETAIGKNIHVIIVLGGDGTLLYLVSLFRDHQHVPPIVCFQRGSLGFLAPFQMAEYKKILNKILDKSESPAIAIRMRLTARIWRHPDNFDPKEHTNLKTKSSSNAALQSTTTSPKYNDEQQHKGHHRQWSKEIEKKILVNNNNNNACDSDIEDSTTIRSPSASLPSIGSLGAEQSMSTPNLMKNGINNNNDDVKEMEAPQMVDNFTIKEDRDISFTKTSQIFPSHKCNDVICHALNEVLIHRDNNASMMQAKLFIDGDECTIIQADGMIFSTPTGSTAYNISAGGSLISPTVPCIALTPICPHTLSFRPVVVSDETIIHIQIPKLARYNAIISFDGRNHFTLKKGDVVEILKCPYSVPTFKSQRFNVEWFQGLVSKFNWNLRELQKPFDDGSIHNDNNNNNDQEDDTKQQ